MTQEEILKMKEKVKEICDKFEIPTTIKIEEVKL